MRMNRFLKPWALLTALSASQYAVAQSAPPKTTAEEEETILLSPFEVKATGDNGYQATDTLGGTRIRTDLRDVGSAISVATKEFMRDIGATDAQSLLQYMTSTEVGGTGGNFLLGSSVGDGPMINDNSARQNPQGNTRVRGLNAADNTRDFFMTDIPFDTYNTSRIDIQRGANSILFGNGSGAGIINAGLDSAQIGVNSANVSARYGSYGSYRGTFDFNKTLLKNELAIRGAFLEDKRYYRQKPAFNEDTRGYGALRYEPEFLKKGSAKTTFRLSYEHGNINANRPRANTINDNMYPWFIKSPIELRSAFPLGRPNGVDQTLMGYLTPLKSHDGYDPFVTNIAQASTLGAGRLDVGARATFNATTNPNSEPWLGAVAKPTDQGASQSGGGFDPENGGYTAWWAQFDSPDASQVSRLIYPGIPTTYNAVNGSGIRDGNGISGIRGPDMQGLTTLTNYSQRGEGSLLYTLQGIWRLKTITDPSVFDFYNKLIDGPNKGEGSKFHSFNVAIDQTFWNDHAGFQAAYDSQDYTSYRWANLNNPSISIDVFKYLPVALLNTSTGLYEPVANPNFGRPYIVSSSGGNNRSNVRRETQRLTPFVDFDTKLIFKDERLAGILGRHTITGLYEKTKVERQSLNYYRYAVEAEQAAALFGPNRPVGDASRNISTYTYLGPSIATASSESNLNISAITAVQLPGNVLTPTSKDVYVSNAYWFDSTWTGAALPAGAGAAYARPALGLAPNALGNATGNDALQAENPNNYRAWSGTPRPLAVDVQSATGDYRPFATSASQSKSQTSSKALVDQWKLLFNNVVITAGLRKDTVRTYTPGNPLLAANSPLRTGSRLVNNNSGLVDWDAPFQYPDDASSSYTSPWLKTYGAVAHTPNFIKKHLPWGLEFSPFWSRSANFQPAIRKDNITGEDLTPPTGSTIDYGVMVSALEGKISLRVTRYNTKIKGASLQDNSILSFTIDEVVRGIQFSKSTLFVRDWNNAGHGSDASAPTAGNAGYFFRADNGVGQALPNNQTHWYPWQPARPATAAQPWTQEEWDAEEAHAYRSAEAFMASLQTPMAQQFLKANNINPSLFDYGAANNNITAVAPNGSSITGDTISRGTEFELFLQPTPNWSIVMNAAKSFATRVNLAGNASQWLQDRWALYNVMDTQYPGGGFLAGDVRWFGGGQGNVSSGNARFGRNGYRFFSEFHSLEGTNVPELRPWRFNATTNYRFTHGPLKGAFAGASFRWEDRSVIGFGMTETDPEVVKQVGSTVTSLRAAFARLDPTKPFYGPTEQHLDLFAGYGRKIAFLRDVDWRIQLNVRNAGEKAHLVPITVLPTGEGASYRIADGMSWEVTNTFRF